jgi:hypothetical protein
MSQGSFGDELFEDIADGLHDFFMSSNWRVSWMNLPKSAIFSATGRDRCFSRHLGMHLGWGGGVMVEQGESSRIYEQNLHPAASGGKAFVIFGSGALPRSHTLFFITIHLCPFVVEIFHCSLTTSRSVTSVVRFLSSDLMKILCGNDWFGNPRQVSIATKLSSTALQRLPRQLPVA